MKIWTISHSVGYEEGINFGFWKTSDTATVEMANKTIYDDYIVLYDDSYALYPGEQIRLEWLESVWIYKSGSFFELRKVEMQRASDDTKRVGYICPQLFDQDIKQYCNITSERIIGRL
jgi:hypothetical protein